MGRVRSHLAVAVLASAAALAIGLGASGLPILGEDARAAAVQPSAAGGPLDLAAAGNECTASPADETLAARACNPCPNKPYCKCKYNGIPRASCEPCCYFSYPTGYVCLD